MPRDRPRQPAYKIFGIKRKFQLSKFQPPKFKEAGAGRGQTLLSPKSGATENARLENGAQKCYGLICVVLHCPEKK